MITATELALNLAANVNAIARLEAAGRCYSEIQTAIDTIERTINRPPSPKYCGNCPAILENQQCNVALYADRDATEVSCWKCKTTYNIEQLITAHIDAADGWLFTAQEILEIMNQIGEPISDRTWRHWRATGKIQSRNEWGAEPKYYIEEVRHLRRDYAHARAS